MVDRSHLALRGGKGDDRLFALHVDGESRPPLVGRRAPSAAETRPDEPARSAAESYQ